MASDYTYLANIFRLVDGATMAYVTNTVTNVTAAVSPVATQAFTLYMFLWGFALYRGLIQEPIMDGTFRLLRIGLILHFAIGAGVYNREIALALQNLPNYLAELLGASAISDRSFTVLDEILAASLDIGTAVWEKGSIMSLNPNPGPYLMAVVIWLSAMACTGYAAFLIVLSKVALALVVALGPIFIACLIFDATRNFFAQWLGQALNYALVSALAVGAIKLLFGIYQAAVLNSAGIAEAKDFGILSVAEMLLISTICFLVLMQVQSIASALGGGVAIQTLGAASWVAQKAGRAINSVPTSPSKIAASVQANKRDLQTAARPVTWAYQKLKGGNSVSERKSA